MKSVYNLCFHYNVSLKKLLKKVFLHNFNKRNIFFFRESTYGRQLILQYLDKTGGNYSVISQKICQLAKDKNISKDKISLSRKKIKKIVPGLMKILNDELPKCMSNDLIDFCCYLLSVMNEYFKNKNNPDCGRQIICSFIIFNIVNPKIINMATTEQVSQIIPLTTILKDISVNYGEQYTSEHVELKNIISKIFFNRTKSSYNYLERLDEHDYQENRTTLIRILKERISPDNLSPSEDIMYTFMTEKYLVT